ncbi:hypothetical protein Q0F98_03530 [Paenibacillus amylolyticus]|nr:hypothetical protein Q0F98_03530 [Paenibacillus amylolyticus]
MAEWMSGRYASNRILSLQVMVPTALKGKAERYISLGDALDGQMAGAQPDDEVLFVWGEESTTEKVQQDIIRFVKSRGQVPLQQLSRKYPNHAALIKKLLLGGVLLESQAIKDKLNKKTMKSVDLAVDIAAAQEALASFPAKAQRQKEILAFLLEMKELLPMPMKEVLSTLQVSATTIKGLEEKGLIVTEDVEVFRDPYQGRTFKATEPLVLTDEQKTCLRQYQWPITGTTPWGVFATWCYGKW